MIPLGSCSCSLSHWRFFTSAGDYPKVILDLSLRGRSYEEVCGHFLHRGLHAGMDLQEEDTILIIHW